MLTVALLLFDLFGLQVERIPDITQDGIDDLVITDSRGDVVKKREGRILIVDPVDWSIVRELEGLPGEQSLGASISIARTEDRSYIATCFWGAPNAGRRVALYSSPAFQRDWTDVELDEGRRLSKFGCDAVCVAETGAAAVYALECSRQVAFRPTHFRLLRRSAQGLNVVSEFDAQSSHGGGPILYPHLDRRGVLDGFYSAGLDCSRPIGRLAFPEADTQISWLDLAQGELCPITPKYGPWSAAGVSLIQGQCAGGRFTSEAVAVRRHEQGGELLFLSSTSVTSSLLFLEPATGCSITSYWGTSLAWIPDIDGDGCSELAVGSPEPFGGEVLIVGSLGGSVLRRVRPPPDGVDATLPEHWTYAPNFGTALCVIPDQDGDGQDDLAVSATTWGGFGMYPAGISIVSTKSWRLLRVVFERDLRRNDSK